MMYRCENCGHLFEDGEQAVWEENQGECHGVIAMERFTGCPLCYDDYSEAGRCDNCEEWFANKEIYGGWCESCLRKSITYNTFFEYCEYNSDQNYLAIFVLNEFMGGMICPENITKEFNDLIIQEYNKRVVAVKRYESLLGEKSSDGFIDKCIRFIMDDDGECGKQNYADWLNEKGVK